MSTAMCGCTISEVNSQTSTKPWMASWLRPLERLEARTTQLASSQVSDVRKLWDNACLKFWVATFERWCIPQTVPWVSVTHTSCNGRQVETIGESPFPHRRPWSQVCMVSKTTPDRQKTLIRHPNSNGHIKQTCIRRAAARRLTFSSEMSPFTGTPGEPPLSFPEKTSNRKRLAVYCHLQTIILCKNPAYWIMVPIRYHPRKLGGQGMSVGK